MKHTTRNEVADMIDEAIAKEAAQLRRDLTATLIELASSAKNRREQDIAATAKLVEATSDYLKQYVKDMTKAPTESPDPYPLTRLEKERRAAEAVGSSGSGDYARGYAAALAQPLFYKSNVELIHHAAYTDGHADALTKVNDLLRDALDSKPSIELFKEAVERLSL